MTPKEREAIQQALEALEGGLWDYGPGQDEHDKCNEVITALRKALAESNMNPNCKSVQARLATSRWYVRAKQAEPSQLADASLKPVAWKHDCAALCANDVELWIDNCPHCGKPRTAAPVRTKDPCNPLQDLTDDEILEISLANKLLLELCYGQMFEMQEVTTDLAGLTKFARAVIAADREKNK